MTDLAKEVRDGIEAKRLMREPLFISAFSAIESALIDRMKRVAMADVNTQHELVLSLQLLGNLRNYFEQIAQTGSLAEEQMAQAKKGRK